MNYWFDILKDNENVVLRSFNKVTYEILLNGETVLAESQSSSKLAVVEGLLDKKPTVRNIPCGSICLDDIDFWQSLKKILESKQDEISVVIRYYKKHKNVDSVLLSKCKIKAYLDVDDYETDVELAITSEEAQSIDTKSELVVSEVHNLELLG